jgi:CRISPR-associated protein Csx10
MKVITYRIELLEPTQVTSLQGDPNSGVAYDYLPGSVLRGIMIGKYLGSQSADAADADDDTLRRLFFNGATRYLNGYPLDAYNQPSLPIPASWQHVKHQEHEIYDLAVAPKDDEPQLQPVSASFYTQSGNVVKLIQPARTIAVHTQRTARFGRAMPELRPPKNSQGRGNSTRWLEQDEIPGAVYRYDALAAGQKFQASIICDHDADETMLLKIIQEVSNGHVTLGGSRSGGYGKARISLIDSSDADLSAVEDEEDEPEDTLIVTLHSNVLLRDARGQYAVDPKLLCRVLGEHLGVELKLKDAFLGTEVMGGFNRKWGLPLPQTLAARMGSVLVFQDPGCDRRLLRGLELRGIGERRAEGFGCIAFNCQRVDELSAQAITPPNHALDAATISEAEASNLARLMVKRMLRQQLGEQVLAAANRIQIANPPSNAQISRLRSIVIEELRQSPPDTRKLCTFIKRITERGIARRQFERSAVVDGKPLLNWLKELLQCDGGGAWAMGINEWKAQLHISGVELGANIGGVAAEIDNDLRLEYALHFINLVLAHAAKQQKEEN